MFGRRVINIASPKQTTFTLKFIVEGYPDRKDMESIKIKSKNLIKRHLYKVITQEITIECQSCGFVNKCNPILHKKIRWFCRSCGHCILYDNAGVKNEKK